MDAVDSCYVRFSSQMASLKFLVLGIALGLAAGCGGSNSPPPVTAPSNLTYPQASITATVGQALPAATPTVTGTVTAYAVSPALPAGLILSGSTGTISGAPTTVTAQAPYTVTASNSGGSTSAILQITVSAPLAPPSNLVYSQTSITATVGQPITPDTPTVTGTVTSYAVSPALPAGLALDSSAGTISGTPTVVTAQASYTVTASNAAGSTTAILQITVSAPLPAPSGLIYPQTTITARVGQEITSDIPTITGTVASYTISPALPTGLTLDSSFGTISGTPTAVAAQATYTVTATNSGGSTTASVTITVNSASTVLLDLGHAAPILLMRAEAASVLSQDNTGHWALWSYPQGAEMASGDQAWISTSPFAPQYMWTVDMAGPTVAIGLTNGLELRSSADGHLLSRIVSPLIDSITQSPAATWWKLASDGSYVCAGSIAGLSVWAPSGQLLVSKQGDYSRALAFAAPGQVQVAVGAAGQGVIETISTASGTSTVGPTFDGQFNSWFLDGSRYLTNEGTTVWTYSSASVQQAIVSLPTIENLTGQGSWIWTYEGDTPAYPLDIYPIGSTSPSLSLNLGVLDLAIPSGTTIGVLQYGTGASSVIDLSGSTPTEANFTFPIAYTSAYAASSVSQWLVGNMHGAILEGASLAAMPQYLGYGTAWSIAGGTARVAVATAIGQILFFDPPTTTPEGAIGFSSSKVAMSSDGTVLAASANSNDAQYEPDRTLNVYSLPSTNVINTWPYTFYGSPTLYDFTLSGSGQTIGQTLGTVGTNTISGEITSVSGVPVGCSPTLIPTLLSPDGTLIAISSGAQTSSGATNIYKNCQLVTAVPGFAVGWIDNNRLLVNNFDESEQGSPYTGATIYNAAGTQVAISTVPELPSFQPVTSDTVYCPQLNAIYSLTSGAATWTTPNPTTGIGSVSGGYVVYASGSLVLADSY